MEAELRPLTLPRHQIVLGEKAVPVLLERKPRARRYIMRVPTDGVPRITVPRGGTIKEALEFAQRHAAWVEKQLLNPRPAPAPPAAWHDGSPVMLRGELMTLVVGGLHAALGDQRIALRGTEGNLRPCVELHLRRLAAGELTARTNELAAQHGVTIQRVSVRNQRSRWGSCSRRGTISLNWRLIQTPVQVRDYIILHELMHRREMNHSARFWKHVETVCPDYRAAEKWLKQNSKILR